MTDAYSGKLQIWEGWTSTVAEGRSPGTTAKHLPDIHLPEEYTNRLYTHETLGSPLQWQSGNVAEPYTLQWFLDIELARYRRHGRWIPSLMEFSRHSGETLLGLGAGLGTDWVQYARDGASVVVCSPSAEHLSLIRRNFDLRELPGRFLQALPADLPIETASIDVVCINDLLHRVREPENVLDEVYRVLKPGGKVLAVTPGKYDIEFWWRLLMPWRRWWTRRREREDGVRYSGRALKQLFHRFAEHRVHKRHLRRADVPHLWRLMPLSTLERLLGRVLILKAFKPLSAAISVSLAA